MAWKKPRTTRSLDPVLPRDVLGFLGEGNSIVGTVELQSGFRVDGRIVGPIRSPSTLVVGPSGEIESDDLHTKALSVSGLVRGKLHVEERLEIRRGGRILGEVTLGGPGLVMEAGAAFDGTVRIVPGTETSE